MGTLQAVQDFKKSADYVPVYIRTFDTGEWVAVAMEHSCCSGAGFNASIFFDSNGSTFVDTTYSFCGVEGMGEELHRVETSNLAGFYSKLTKLKLQKR